MMHGMNVKILQDKFNYETFLMNGRKRRLLACPSLLYVLPTCLIYGVTIIISNQPLDFEDRGTMFL